MVVVDIGANIGFYTSLLSKLVGNEGYVHAFEPDVRNYKRLSVNSIKLKNVYLNNCAIGPKTGKIRLYKSYNLNTRHQTFDDNENRKYVEVECSSIDDYFKNNEKVDFIKIDIEGYDYFAIIGMKETIRRSNNAIILGEFCPLMLEKSGINPSEYIEFFEKEGFFLKFFNLKNNDYKSIIHDKTFIGLFYGIKRI